MREFLHRHRIVVLSALVATIAVVVIILALTGVFSGEKRDGETVPGYVASVNGSEITREALDTAAADLTSYYRQLAGGETDLFDGAAGAYLQLRIFHEALTELTRQALIRSEARARRITVDEDEVEERTEERYMMLLGQFGIAEQQHAAYLEASGSSIEEYKASLRSEVEMQLLTEAVQAAVIEETNPDEGSLRTYFDENQARYAVEGEVPEFSEIRERVRSDYLEANESAIIGGWYQDLLAGSRIEITIPLLHAYDLQMKDPEQGIAEFGRLHREGVLADPYLPYYMARAVENKVAAVELEIYELEELDALDEGQASRLESLREERAELEARAVSWYVETLLLTEWDEALIARAIRLDPAEPTKSFLDGVVKAVGGDREGAVEALDAILQEDPSFVPAYVTLGDLARRLGDTDEAQGRYEDALGAAPEDVVVLLRIAELQLANGEFPETWETLAEVRRIEPSSPWLRIAEGDLALAELEAAAEEWESASGSARAELSGRIEALSAEAVAAYRDALERSGDLEINLKLGRVLLLAGDLDEAQSEFEYVLRYSPYAGNAYEGHGDVLEARGDAAGAVEDYRTALSLAVDSAAQLRLLNRIVDLSPDSVEDRLDLAEIYKAQERWADAAAVYDEVLGIDPALTDVYVQLGEVYREAGEFRLAEDALRKGLEQAGFVTQRIRFLEAIIATFQAEVGEGQPLPEEGLDAHLRVAALEIDMGRFESSLGRIRAVRDVDPSYRVDDVVALLHQIRDEAPSLLTEEERGL